MAEFKLGRIRFVWQGDWAPGTVYVADDVVSNGGKSYICIRNHTASPEFTTDFTSELPKWDIVSDGTSWRAEWEPEVEYNPGDVVKYGALVYICEEGHTSASFEAPDFLGLEEDLDKWTPFATSFDFKGPWTTSNRYKINDLVSYGGFAYICNTAHISSSSANFGLEADQSKWSLFTEGLVYLGEWAPAVRYRLNDLVKSGGNVWICVNPHTSSDFLAQEDNWEIFIEGFQFEDSWNNSTQYQVGDTVTYGGYVYVAKQNNENSQPTTNPSDWDVFTTGFKFQGDWAVLTAYRVGDVVRIGGTTYVAIADSTGNEPPNPTYWSRLNSGINWTNSVDTYLQVAGTNITGSGSGARFDIVKSKTVYTVSVSTGFAGIGYVNGNKIRILGSSLGGLSPANDIEITVTGVTGGAITAITWTGYSSTWKSGTKYFVGDVVVFGASSFICVQQHTAASGNRPDLDLTADFWNLLTLGSEAFALTTPGDLVYYGENGPTRLPIGVDGQILRVSGGFPSWANYGLIDNVVYVGPLGTNEPAPASGLTIDKPWASVRYALDQVRDGYLNPNAKVILRNNKQFLMKEVTNWITFTYTVYVTGATSGTQVFTCGSTANLSVGMPIEFSGTLGGVTAGTTYYVEAITSSTQFRISNTLGGTPRTLTTGIGSMTGTLSYDSTFCERDTGLIVDALIYDISRGGTLKTTNAANAYYTPAGNAYINANFGTQTIQTVAAYNHLKSIVAKVLNNEQPVSFQSLNGVSLEERIPQTIDLSIEAESEAVSKSATLMDIITNGILAGSSTAIPPSINPNTTVFIKTGTYNEILPIIVPEYTAIVGDELRTSVIQPAFAVELLANDKNKTTSALNRIKSVIPDLMQNFEITPTTGNTEIQQYLNGYGGNTLSSNRLDTGVDVIVSVLEEGLDYVDEIGIDYGPLPTSGSNNASDVGFANARAQLIANKAFIQDEITSWIADQVDGELAPFASDFTYNAEACARDVGYIIDAICYDLTYGGNLETIVAARAYFVDGSPVYGSGEKEETLAAYARLKTVVGQVIQETTVTASSGTSILQDTTGTAGSAGAATFAEARVQEIYDTIDLDGVLPTEILPDTSWVSTTLVNDNADILSAKSAIEDAVIDHINSTYGNFRYDSSKCRRDTEILKTNAAYDIGLNTNFNAVRDGLAYRRGMSETVIQDQLTQTVGAITQARTLVAALLTAPTAVTRNTAYWNEVIDIIQNGTAAANAIVWSDTGVTAKTTARTEIQTNRAAIISALTSWIATEFPALSYNVAVCERDTGYIIDAISYDVQYGGNSATQEAARAYFAGSVKVLPLSQRQATADAIEELSDIIQSYVSGTTEKTQVDGLLQIIVNVINAGSLLALPAKTYPDVAWGGLTTDVDAVLNDTTVVPAVLQFITNTYTGFVYNHEKCSRDIGYMLDALRYDIMFGSTFRSLKSGMAYRRGIASTSVVLNNQLEATVGSINYLKKEIREITEGSSRVISNTELIKNILVTGTEPSSFTITDPVGYDTGFFNARRLIRLNRTFIVAEVEAFMSANYNSLWTSLSAGDKTKCLRDIGYILDALDYDLTYRGNLETVVAARSYYSDGLFVEPSNQKTAALAVQARIRDIIDNIATANTAGWTKSVGNSLTQNTTGTAGSAGAAAFAQDRVQEIYDTIDTGIEPALITPSVVWVDSALQQLKSVIDSRRSIIQQGAIDYINFLYPDLVYNEELCARDVGYIVDAIVYDVIFNSNFRSAKAGMSYRRGITSTEVVIDNQLEPTLSTIEFINEAVLTITEGSTSELGKLDSARSAKELADTIKDIVQNGLSAIPAIKLPQPNGFNTSSLTDTPYAATGNTSGSTATYGNAVEQIVANYEFMKAEVSAWLANPANGFDAIWTGLGATGQAACIRDVGYLLDAIRYDLTYGGNTQSLIVGSSYYSNFILTIGANEVAATVAAYTRLRTVLGQVIQETSVTKSPSNALNQNTAGTAGNAASAAFAQARVTNVINWINNGDADATIWPSTKWVRSDVKAAFDRVLTQKSEIVEDTVYWVEKFWQKLRFNQNTCRRDAGYMVDAIAYDMLTGSNFASIIAGRSYYRATTSAQEVVNNELEATVGAINFLKHKIKHVASINANTSAELIIDDITAYIHGGAKPAIKWVAPSTADAQYLAAATTIWENKAFIQAEALAFIEEEYPNIVYSQEKCSRDVGMLIDALRYDLTYGGHSSSRQFGEAYYIGTTLQIDVNDKDATLATYDYIKDLVGELALNTLTSVPLQNEVNVSLRDSLQVIGSSAAATRAEDLVQIMIDVINNGISNPVTQIDIDSISSNTLNTLTAHGLKVGDYIVSSSSFNNIESNVTYVVLTTPTATSFTISTYFGGPTFVLSNGTGLGFGVSATLNPDTSLASSALKQQATNLQGSKSIIKTRITEYIAENYPTLVYDSAKCERDVGLIVDAITFDMLVDSNYKTVIAALAYYRGAQADLVLTEQKTATVQSYRELKNLIETYISGSATAVKRSNNLMDIIINILDKGDGDTPEINGTTKYFNDLEVIKGAEILKANKQFLANEATAWVTQSFGGVITSVAAGSNGYFDLSVFHNFSKGDPIVFSAPIAGLTAGTTYYVYEVISEVRFSVTDSPNGARLSLTSSISGGTTVRYKFDATACRRDMERYVDAIVYDLQHPGNHKGWKAAQLYLNAVNGSQRSDMFHVRNSTGVRNMTLNGLRGNLSELNEFGTRRPTAGAYVSLDPGFGPWDTEAWVTNKSCYVQNVSTFGVGCVGNKIDGAIHAGGNRSVVSNDFTQILSDGIGVWCSGNDSLTELVSVFAYYNYAGYLADFGARIRATNGNSSYGTYGVIAEGTDTGEIPLFADVDNLAQDALIGEVNTSGVQVLRFEYANAGRNYTNAEIAISGDGFNATTLVDEFRDGAVFETRIVDLDNGNDVGGEDYVTARNVAQGGDPVTITIAATDTALSNGYNGMRVQLTAGTGVGQYANILSYNNGTKVARVYKDSFENLTITATTATTNRITVADTSTLYVDMPIYVGSAVGGLAINTPYYVTSIVSGTQFTVSDEEGGTNEVLTTTTGQSVTLYAAGWDHIIPGTTIANTLDLTTGYVIEPRIKYTDPGFKANARTLPSTTTWGNLTYGNNRFVAVTSNGTATAYSSNGVTWTAGGTITNAAYTDLVFGGGQGATATAVVGGLGGRGAVFEAVLGTINSIGLPGPTQIQSIRVVNGGSGYTTPPTIEITPTLGGGGAQAVCTVLDGVIQEVIVVSTGAGYGAAPNVTARTDKITDIVVNTRGKNYFSPPTVVISGGGASTQATATAVINNQGVTSITLDTAGEGYTSTPTVQINDPVAKFVAIANGATTNAYLPATSAVGANWTNGNALPNSNFRALAYGNGVYVAVGGSGGSGGAATSTDGISWVSRTNTSLSVGNYSAIAYGSGTFVAINSGGNQTSTTTNGITWGAGGNLPASAVWTSVAFGNNRFVAIASASRTVAYSLDKGATWLQSPAGLPSSQTWTTVRYAQGLFVAIAQGTTVCATSPDGVTWTERALPSVSNWKGLAFGNTNQTPIWAVTSNTSGTAAVSVKTGARALGRLAVADGRISQTRMAEPGSGYPRGAVQSTDAPNTITLDNVDNLVDNQPIMFSGISNSLLNNDQVYYIVAGSINTLTNAIQVSLIQASGIPVTVETGSFSGATFRAAPISTVTDPNATVPVAIEARVGDGSLANPTFTNRGTGYTTATAELSGDGFADLFQPSTFISVRNLFDIPAPGSNVEFANIPEAWYKLVTVSNVIGEPGNYSATFQISPGLEVLNAPRDGVLITTTNKYSQVRLTGHDFLYIGTGNQADTNYPFVDITTAIQSNQQLSSGGGRVFFTSTDQDGNFNVGNLFGVQQSTGTATLDADAFNLAGLQSLQLGGISVGIGSAIITQFSTDPFFTANSDNIIPTQRAIKSYITAQIGGGQSSLNVNTLTAGVVFIANDEITTTSGGQLNIKAKMNFTGGIDGAPVALGFFLQR